MASRVGTDLRLFINGKPAEDEFCSTRVIKPTHELIVLDSNYSTIHNDSDFTLNDIVNSCVNSEILDLSIIDLTDSGVGYNVKGRIKKIKISYPDADKITVKTVFKVV